MQYQLLLLDIDGTLRPAGERQVPVSAEQAVAAVQKAGVKVAIATGRGYGGIPHGMLRGIRPDYWVCAAGAQVVDAAGHELFSDRMGPEQMHALVDFFEDYELPLNFTFSDGAYSYVCYEKMRQHYLKTVGSAAGLHDGEDQNRHLEEMPFSAFGQLPLALLEKYRAKYGYLGLRMMYYADESCDILRPDQDKAHGLQRLLQTLGLPATAAVAVGDGENDCGILQAAGLGVCVADGCDAAKAAADRLCPAPTQGGIAALCRELWPRAFASAAAAV